jgi:type II secretory pathway component GspD/PulD (secretin)
LDPWTGRVIFSIKKIDLRNFLYLSLVLFIIFLFTTVSAGEVAVIKVQYRKAEELVPVVRSMLSAGGSVTVSKRVNSLVIVDTAEAIRRVQAYIEQFDTPVFLLNQ